MAEPNKQQVGDGSDNYGQAASQAAKAAKAASKAGKEVAQQAVQKVLKQLQTQLRQRFKPVLKAAKRLPKLLQVQHRADLGVPSFRRRGHYAIHCLRFSSAFALQ